MHVCFVFVFVFVFVFFNNSKGLTNFKNPRKYNIVFKPRKLASANLNKFTVQSINYLVYHTKKSQEWSITHDRCVRLIHHKER